MSTPPDTAPEKAARPAKKDAYHHGDLRAALLRAAAAQLAEAGASGFSLRAVARRVGVSHSAPAHHFGDAAGLLDALATQGFRDLLAEMQAGADGPGADPSDRLIAAGTGYVRFAERSPEVFRLMFGPDRIRSQSEDLAAAAAAAYRHLVATQTAVSGDADPQDLNRRVAASWSLVHGLATLLSSGHMLAMQSLTGPARDAMIRDVVARIARP